MRPSAASKAIHPWLKTRGYSTQRAAAMQAKCRAAMPRPILALTHPDAIVHNLGVARARASGARVWAMAKADAYGHRLALALPGLASADGIAVLDVAEAEQVRAWGWRGPLLLVEGCFEPRDLEACSRLSLWHVVHRAEQIDWLAAHKTHSGHTVLLKHNSGMNRLGFTSDTLRSAWARLVALPQVDEVQVMTHFADADRSGGVGAALAAFDAATQGMAASRSLAASASILREAGANAAAIHGDWVRAGILVYGGSPDFPTHSAADWGLQPAMSLRSALIGVQHLAAGSSVGYGSTFTASAAMRIGIAACGYADGYPRHAGTGTPVLVDGVRTRTLGRVSMDLLAVDLTPTPHAGCGSEVTLWGRAASGTWLSVDEVAHAAGTIGYELLCAVAPRVARALG